MTLVTPTMTEMSIALGILKRVIPKKQRMPMMRESRIFPLMKPPNTRLASAVRSSSQSARCCGRMAYQTFLQPAQNRSLSSSM